MRPRNDRYLIPVSLLLVILIILMAGCFHKGGKGFEEAASIPPINKLVVAGFQALIDQGQRPDVVHDSLTGSVYIAEPVSDENTKKLNKMLFEKLAAKEGLELISPRQSEGAYYSILQTDKGVDMTKTQVLQEMGRSFGGDAVLAGYLYRWRQRVGTNYGVKSAASVAFDLWMLDPKDGRILWRSKFDKTQQSLTENLLEASSLFKAGFRWLTVEEYAALGLEEVLQKMPLKQRDMRGGS